MAETFDEWKKRSDARRERWRALTAEIRENMVRDLFQRTSRLDDGMRLLHQLYPNAPEEMVRTAAWHLYEEAPKAALDFLAEVEWSLRDPHEGFHNGIGINLLYHFYNYLQFAALLPHGREGMIELVQEIKECVANDDKGGALGSLEELEKKLEGCESAPDVL